MTTSRTRGTKPWRKTSCRGGSSWRPRLEMLEARMPLATLPVAIEINGTTSQSDDLTLLDPGSFVQPVQAVVRNDGTLRTITLDVTPVGAITLDQTTLVLGGDASATITITPVVVSHAANDVTITATSDGLTVGSEDMTVVSVQLPQHIRNADTPAGMRDRIPPRVPTPLDVQVVPDLGASDQFVTLTVAGQSPSNGTATVNGMSASNITSTGSVVLSGTTQTAPTPGLGGGNAGNLKLSAQVRGQDTVQSDGFSVAAIPQNWSIGFQAMILRTKKKLGFIVFDRWQSDSGNPGDLDAVAISEMVHREASGVLGKPPLSFSGYLPATDSSGAPIFTEDEHSFPRNLVKKPGGSSVTFQTHIFLDQRTGALNIPVTNSGYLIVKRAFRGRDGFWRLTTTKLGAATVANGFASAAGAGGPFTITQRA